MAFPKLLIFDMDGLLFDTERMFMNLRAKVLEKHGYVHREEDYLRTVGTAGDLLYQILEEIYGPEYPIQTITQETRMLQKAYIREHGLPVKPGISDLLKWAAEREIPCCVASSSQAEFVDEFLKIAGIRDFFSSLIGGDQVTHAKPDPEIFLSACAYNKTKPSDALVLEDSENGILAASNGGIPVICIPDLKVPKEEVLSKAEAVFETAAQVIPWLETR
ncbi:MAG: HAD family phosphatase [Parasporobacterium sp.]|nr:HAD family phosphatase [Parasporobacterium sp.]